MHLKAITSQERECWNDFVANSPESSILQSYEWGEIKASFGWEPIRLAVEENANIVAGISILKRVIPHTKRCIFYSPRGPIVDFENRGLLHLLLEGVEKEAEKHHALMLKIDPEILENESTKLKNLEISGFIKAGKQVQPRATYFIDLSQDLDSLLKSFEEKTRYNIRLSEKKGIQIKELPNDEGVNAFYEVYQVTAKRDKFLIHPLSYYQKIKENIIEHGMGNIFVAYYEGKPIAAVYIFSFGSKVWYMYGASSDEYRNLMANHGLHWSVIKWAKERGYKTYDLWGIPAAPNESHPLWGVYRFKKGFKGKMNKFIGAYDLPFSPLYYHLFEKGLSILQNIRSLITKGKIEDSLGE